GSDCAAEFVAGDQRRMNALLRPSVPIVDMQIGPADGSDLHLHQHVVRPRAGDFDVANLSAGAAGGLDHGQHGCGHQRGPRSGGRRADKVWILAREKRGYLPDREPNQLKRCWNRLLVMYTPRTTAIRAIRTSFMIVPLGIVAT